MITVEDLVAGHDGYGLWHGTKASIETGLAAGTDAIGEAKDIMRIVWEKISEAKGKNLSEIYSTDVEEYFSDPTSLSRAIEIGNSIRYLRGNFNYSVIAFALDKFTARGYAESGSELANAILAVGESALLEYADVFQDEPILEMIQRALASASNLISNKGKLLKLVQMPADGFFCSPSSPAQEVRFLSCPPFEDRIIYSELFFKGNIPLDHFMVDEI